MDHSVSSKHLLEKYWKVISRTIDEDGLIQTKYIHINIVETELFTKITINLLYEEHFELRYYVILLDIVVEND